MRKQIWPNVAHIIYGHSQTNFFSLNPGTRCIHFPICASDTNSSTSLNEH